MYSAIKRTTASLTMLLKAWGQAYGYIKCGQLYDDFSFFSIGYTYRHALLSIIVTTSEHIRFMSEWVSWRLLLYVKVTMATL